MVQSSSTIRWLCVAILCLFVFSAKGQQIVTVPDCERSCDAAFHNVTVHLDKNKGGGTQRIIIFAPNLKHDKIDFMLATGAVMMSYFPSVTGDERGEMLMKVVTHPGERVSGWGLVWQFAVSGGAVRLIAEPE